MGAGRWLLAAPVVVAAVALGACTSSTGTGTPSSTASNGTTSSSGSSAVGPSGAKSSTTSTKAAKPSPVDTSTVPSVPVVTLSPVPLHARARYGTGVTVRLVSLRHGKVTGQGPGIETGKPAVDCVLQLTNDSRHAISLDTVEVNVTYGESATPAPPSDAQQPAFSGRLARHASAEGGYAFSIPTSGQSDITITVSYAAGQPVVVLHGSAR